jgi:hypothetical protein
MLKTIQMQKAKPTQKQNKKPTHNAGKITKKKLKKPRFIGGAKKNISELSIKEKLEFLKHCLNNTIHGDLRGILYTANEKALKYFPTYEVGYIDMFKIVIKYVLLCLINNSTNSDYKDITRSNNCYLLLKNKCPYKRCQYSIDFESEKYLDSKEEEELNKIADQYYDTFKNYVSEIVKKPHDNKTINKYIKDIYPGGIAILTKKSDNDKYDLKINNSETPIEEYSKIIDFLKKNTNTKFLIILKRILKKESSNTDNTDETDVYNCMMQIIMKLVDIFSSENNSKYYEMIIKGKDENAVYLSMNEDASRESLTVAQEERLKEQANQTNKETEQNQGIHKVEIAKTPETAAEAKAPETAAEAKTPETAKIEAQTAATVATVAEADKKARTEKEAIKNNTPKDNLDKLLNYIFNDDNRNKQLDLQRHAILLKNLKRICYNKFSQEYGIAFKEQIDNIYIAKINEKNTENKTRIINDSKLDYLLTKQKCDSNDMIEAYQHIINILVPKYGLDIAGECYKTLIALSKGGLYGDCKKTIGDILTQKSYLLSEPTIMKVLLTEKYLKNREYKEIAIEELKKFKNKVLEILNEIFGVSMYKKTQSNVLNIYKSLFDTINSNSSYSTFKSELAKDIVKEYKETKKKLEAQKKKSMEAILKQGRGSQ